VLWQDLVALQINFLFLCEIKEKDTGAAEKEDVE
jgi:hypothetical protein